MKDFAKLISSRVVNLDLKETSKGVRGNQSSPRTESSPETSSYGKWFELEQQGLSKFSVGARVLDYCSNTEQTRAFVFFSLDDEKVIALLKNLASLGSIGIVYASKLELSEIGSRNLIELCYGEKPFFTEQIKRRMSRERFPIARSAFVVIYELLSPDVELRPLKTNLRNHLGQITFERRIHGTDDHSETLTLVEAITNPNTLYLLNRVNVSRTDRVFSRIPLEFRNQKEICVDGSSTMELYGLRKSRDLDFITNSSSMVSKITSLGYDVNHEHFSELPFSHNEVVDNPYLHVRLFGVKFSSINLRQLMLELRFASEGNEFPAKKMRDLELIRGFQTGNPGGENRVIGLVATVATQFRLIFEFAVQHIMPRLPRGIAEALRKLRRLL